MNTATIFTIDQWFALAPQLNSREDWVNWAQSPTPLEGDLNLPVLDFVPALQRRRLSPLLKMAMYCSYQLHQSGHLDNVFASRHGDLHSTDKMLLSIAEAEPVSPTLFSHAVHNAAPGLFSILTGNTAPHSAVAAGPETFSAGLVEAVNKLKAENLERILYCYYDYLVPDHYQTFLAEKEAAVAIAMILSPATAGGITLSLERSTRPGTVHKHKAVHFLNWILEHNATQSLTLDEWQFSRR